MRNYIALSLATVLAASAQAQLFRPEAVNGAALGAVAGAIIGNNSGDLHHNAWKGAAIGAGAGLLIGAAIGEDRHDNRPRRVYAPAPVYPRYGYSYHHGPAYGVTYVSRPYYGNRYYYGRPSYASSGLFWGGLTGAIIGHNSGSLHHNGWRGAAIGAGAGLLLGSILDAREREVVVERPVIIDNNPVETSAPAKQAAPQQVTIINNYYGNTSAMSQANGLFGR